MGVLIRDLVQEDHDDWMRLFTAYLKFYKTVLDDDVKEKVFEKLIDPKIQMWSALAINEETGKPIGMVNYLQHLQTWDVKDEIYLSDLYVDENQRLKNTGRKLIEYVYKFADQNNTPKVYWVTQTFNHRAQMLYCNVGEFCDMVRYMRPPK